MKRKKLIAGVSAGILAIVSSATSVSAFADEVNLVQERKVDNADLLRLNKYLAGLVYPL